MDINWAELLVGGTIFFVLGSIFTIFIQPGIERRLEARREKALVRREEEDARFAAEVALLSSSSSLYSAVFRREITDALVSILRVLLYVVIGLAVDSVVYPAGLAVLSLAIASLIPLSTAVRRLRQVTGAVAEMSWASADDGTPG